VFYTFENNDKQFVLIIPTLFFLLRREDQSNNFQYFLKTDDDVFIDLQQVRSKLQTMSSLTNWWWSSFRENWPVQKFGKWRDDSYNSITYPPFPCGAGYILSADLVRFIARNADFLHYYQGEDVSLGIWLAPLNPTLQSDCWQCSLNVPRACNQPELTPENMYHTWKSLN
jgi:beta-1,3-N-acetylgalactosaminyltransferase 2